jgi:hypothetical protein
LSSFCEGRASAECSQQVLLDCAIADASTCIANRQQLCISQAPPHTIYESGRAENCVTQVAAAYSDGEVTLNESEAIDVACAPVFDGPGMLNSACQSDTDCKLSQNLTCVMTPGATAGSCQIPVAVDGGGTCALPNQQCVAGFHCGITAHCDIDGALNDPCDSANPCDPTLDCAPNGVCAAKGADGSPCTTGDQCAHGICNKAPSEAMGLCVSQVTLSPTEPFCTESQ